MYRVIKDKIRGVKSKEFPNGKNYYKGDLLPSDYIPHQSYIFCGIVEEVKEDKKKKGGK